MEVATAEQAIRPRATAQVVALVNQPVVRFAQGPKVALRVARDAHLQLSARQRSGHRIAWFASAPAVGLNLEG